MHPGYLAWLWQNRTHPQFASKLWIKTWAKRVLNVPALLGSITRLARIQRKGATIQFPIFCSPAMWNGPLDRFRVGRGSVLGRVEFHLHAPITIGRNVIINDGVRILTGTHSTQDPQFALVAKSIEICDYAWVAVGATLLPGVRIGRGAVVGACAVVTHDVPDYAVVAGNPARLLNKNRPHQLTYEPLRFVAAFEAWLGRSRSESSQKYPKCLSA